jgi:hypothetical protein
MGQCAKCAHLVSDYQSTLGNNSLYYIDFRQRNLHNSFDDLIEQIWHKHLAIKHWLHFGWLIDLCLDPGGMLHWGQQDLGPNRLISICLYLQWGLCIEIGTSIGSPNLKALRSN